MYTVTIIDSLGFQHRKFNMRSYNPELAMKRAAKLLGWKWKTIQRETPYNGVFIIYCHATRTCFTIQITNKG